MREMPYIQPYHVYVAINAQYHDYAKLFEEWFGGNIDNKVFESAIIFWFKDVDFDGDKVRLLSIVFKGFTLLIVLFLHEISRYGQAIPLRKIYLKIPVLRYIVQVLF